MLYDSVRGVGRQIYADTTGAEDLNLSNLYSFNQGGFSLGQSSSDDVTNDNHTFVVGVGRHWSTVTNNDGTITTQVSVNKDAGFSIITYTGTGADEATIGHGLGRTPLHYD